MKWINYCFHVKLQVMSSSKTRLLLIVSVFDNRYWKLKVQFSCHYSDDQMLRLSSSWNWKKKSWKSSNKYIDVNSCQDIMLRTVPLNLIWCDFSFHFLKHARIFPQQDDKIINVHVVDSSRFFKCFGEKSFKNIFLIIFSAQKTRSSLPQDDIERDLDYKTFFSLPLRFFSFSVSSPALWLMNIPVKLI